MPHKGVCVAGPMAGLTVETRSDYGFVAVDKPGGAAWVYRANPDNGRFELDHRPDDSLLNGAEGLRELDLERLLTAGPEHAMDVIALPHSVLEDEEGDEPELDDLFATLPELTADTSEVS